MRTESSRQAKYNAKKRHGERDIAPLPAVVNPERRAATSASLQLFLETYFPRVFCKGWSPDHLKLIARLQTTIERGGRFLSLMPRGSGKTSLNTRAALWAILTGRCPYLFLVTADAEKSKALLRSLKTELEFNQLLYEDFPEACYPIRCLEGISLRAMGQHFNGEPTNIGWKIDRVVFPTIPGSACSGAIIACGGITGAVRGANHTVPHADGTTTVIRPTVILVDDFQTRESAASPTQCKTRLDILAGDIAGMAGPGEQLSILATATVTFRDDAADQLIDRKAHPEWHGERHKLVYEWPTQKAMWESYCDLYVAALAEDRPTTDATEFYRANRELMDAGAVVGWEDRKEPSDLSAIQHAYHLRLQVGEEAFASEYQNEPLAEQTELKMLATPELIEKQSSYARGMVPGAAVKLTAFADLQGTVLFWQVWAWSGAFDGWLVDFGTWPEQGRINFALRDVRKTLQSVYPVGDDEAAMYAGISALIDHLAEREFQRADGASVRVSRIGIDANWGAKTQLAKSCIRASKHAALVMPCHGKGIGPAQRPISQWTAATGRKGTEWIITKPERRDIESLLYDTNYWKTRFHAALAAPPGSKSGLLLPRCRPAELRMVADQLTAEVPTKHDVAGRTVFEWKLKKKGLDNHYLDCAVGAMVMASLEGVSNVGVPVTAKRRKRSVRYLK